MKASDFTSQPGATMEDVRKDAAMQVRLYSEYFRQARMDAMAVGLNVQPDGPLTNWPDIKFISSTEPPFEIYYRKT